MSQDMRRATRDNAESRVNIRPPRSDLSIDYHLRGGTFRLNTSNRDALALFALPTSGSEKKTRKKMIQRSGDRRSRDLGSAGLIRGLADALAYILHVRDVDIFIGISNVALSLKHDCVPAHPPPLLPSSNE